MRTKNEIDFPALCRDGDAVTAGSGYKIYGVAELKSLYNVYNSVNVSFIPYKKHVINAKAIYEGAIDWKSNGHDLVVIRL